MHNLGYWDGAMVNLARIKSNRMKWKKTIAVLSVCGSLERLGNMAGHGASTVKHGCTEDLGLKLIPRCVTSDREGCFPPE